MYAPPQGSVDDLRHSRHRRALVPCLWNPPTCFVTTCSADPICQVNACGGLGRSDTARRLRRNSSRANSPVKTAGKGLRSSGSVAGSRGRWLGGWATAMRWPRCVRTPSVPNRMSQRLTASRRSPGRTTVICYQDVLSHARDRRCRCRSLSSSPEGRAVADSRARWAVWLGRRYCSRGVDRTWYRSG